ncbi:hypothetical protein R84B8_01830 [Treponema sp. R8-4-B8]
MKEHGNEKFEKERGQIAVNESDFDKIHEIVKSPDHVMVGGKYTEGHDKNKSFIAYAKKMKDGTTFYYEVVLEGKNNKSLRGKTMYKWKNAINEQKFHDTISSASGIDTSKTKIISLAAIGGYPDLRPTIKESGMVANPTKTQGLSTSNITEFIKKSREIETVRKAGYVQGVCECVAAIGDDHALGKKLLTEMKVNKEMAKKFANPETFKKLEQGIFAPEQKQEQTNAIKR